MLDAGVDPNEGRQPAYRRGVYNAAVVPIAPLFQGGLAPGIMVIDIRPPPQADNVPPIGMTLLMRVAQCRRPQATDALRLLVDAGADIQAADLAGRTAFDFAAQTHDQVQAVDTAEEQFGDLWKTGMERIEPWRHGMEWKESSHAAGATAIDLLRVA